LKKSNYVVEVSNDEKIVLCDIGPWDQYSTITNNAEGVIAELHSITPGGLGDRKVFYYDSEGDYDELGHDGEGNFTTFYCARK